MSRLVTVACVLGLALALTRQLLERCYLSVFVRRFVCSVHLTVKDIRACHIAEGSQL